MHELSAERISYFFNLAVEQYEEIDLIFQLDLCPYSQMRALCVGVKNGHFIVRVTLEELDNEPIIWGTEANGYFSVRDEDAFHFHFRAKLARMYNAPPNAMFLIFPLPTELDRQQRRFSRRVTLDETFRQKLTVWHGYLTGGDPETPPRPNWQPLTNSGCEVGELSANGVRLDVDATNPLYPKLFINDPILLRGNFGAPQKPLSLYILGNIVRKMRKPDSENAMSVGCHFTSWRKAEANAPWFRSDPREGIGQLAQWISRNYHTFNS